MKELARRFWLEPAVCIGTLGSLVLLALALATGADWDAALVAGVAGPLLAALGIRPLVSPAREPDVPPIPPVSSGSAVPPERLDVQAPDG